MYVTYEEYKSIGGTLTEEEFNRYLPGAEAKLDSWTLNRLRSEEVAHYIEVTGQEANVKRSMFVILESWKTILAAKMARAKGTELSSFSNGVDSFTFIQGGWDAMSSAERVTYEEVLEILPIELTSRCVSFFHAN